MAFASIPIRRKFYYACMGWAHYAAGQYEDAVKWLQRDATHHRTGSQRILAASLAQLGRMNEARKEAREFLAMIPDFTVQQWATTRPFSHKADRQHFIDGYMKAGLPP
jgi:tetratricopeptide (TPR) repeat protein